MIDSKPFHEISYWASATKGACRKFSLPFIRVVVEKLPPGIEAFAVTSDIQGRDAPIEGRLLGELVAEELSLLQECSLIPPLEFIALAGDLFEHQDFRKLGGTGDVNSVWRAFSERFPSVIGVNGNHDLLPHSLPKNAVVLDGDIKNIAGLRVGGVSGIIGNQARNNRKSENDFHQAVTKVAQRNPDIIMLHEGPEGSDPLQPGNKKVSELLASTRSTVFFGHKYWDNPFSCIGNAQVLNCARRVLVVHR